jgi:hypothetical protein
MSHTVAQECPPMLLISILLAGTQFPALATFGMVRKPSSSLFTTVSSHFRCSLDHFASDFLQTSHVSLYELKYMQNIYITSLLRPEDAYESAETQRTSRNTCAASSMAAESSYSFSRSSRRSGSSAMALRDGVLSVKSCWTLN